MFHTYLRYNILFHLIGNVLYHHDINIYKYAYQVSIIMVLVRLNYQWYCFQKKKKKLSMVLMSHFPLVRSNTLMKETMFYGTACGKLNTQEMNYQYQVDNQKSLILKGKGHN